MAGVEILNTIYKYGELIHPLWFCIFFATSLVVAMVGACTIKHDVAQRICVVFIAITIISAIVCFIGALITTDEIVDTQYQVVVSDDVNFNEFQEKYEIIKQEGKIYTVRERN